MNTLTGPLTFLSSDKHGLVTIYDASAESDGFCRLARPPYALSSLPLGSRRVGHAFLRHPSQSHDKSAMLLQLSERGSIHRMDITLDDAASDRSGMDTHYWSSDIQAIERATEGSREDSGSLSQRTHTEVDLQDAYLSTLLRLAWDPMAHLRYRNFRPTKH